MKKQQSVVKNFIFILCLILILPSLSCEKINEVVVYKEANKYFNAEEFELAIVKYQQLTTGKFYQKEAWLHIGYSYLALVRSSLDDVELQKNSEFAIGAFKEYLKLVPDDQQVEDYIFNTYMDARNYDKVLEFLFEKFESNPQDIRAIQLIIQTYEDMGKIYEAIEWYKKRIEVQVTDPSAYYAFAVFYWRNSYYNLRLEETFRATMVNEGIDLIQKALELDPEFADAYTYWGLLLREKASKYTRSKREQEKLLEEANQVKDKSNEIRKLLQEREGTLTPTTEQAQEGESTEQPQEGVPTEQGEQPEGGLVQPDDADSA